MPVVLIEGAEHFGGCSRFRHRAGPHRSVLVVQHVPHLRDGKVGHQPMAHGRAPIDPPRQSDFPIMNDSTVHCCNSRRKREGRLILSPLSVLGKGSNVRHRTV